MALFWFFVFAVIASVVGVILSIVFLPLTSKISSSSGGGRFRLFMAWGISVVIFSCGWFIFSCSTAAFFAFKNYGDFYEYPGIYDSWRIPLEYPYEIAIIDTLDDGTLSDIRENSRGNLLHGITHYGQHVSYIVSEYGRGRVIYKDPGWFIFDLMTGVVERFPDEESFQDGLSGRGIPGDIELRSIEENLDRYWREH